MGCSCNTKTIVYKLRHKPTGLFYQPVKGRWSNQKSHLGVRGKVYQTNNIPKVTGYVNISEALVKKHNIDCLSHPSENRMLTKEEDWEVVNYELNEINA